MLCLFPVAIATMHAMVLRLFCDVVIVIRDGGAGVFGVINSEIGIVVEEI